MWKTKTDVGEALRYLGIGNASDEMLEQVKRVAEQTEKRFEPKYLFRVFTLNRLDDRFQLAGTDLILNGKTAEKMLAECHSVAVFICTLGFEFDSYLRSLQVKNMSEAVITDACGSALVESGCDEAQKEIKELFHDMYITDRFSAGYGDLPLEIQDETVKILDAEKKLGVHLTETKLFNPCKTVSAFVGISDTEQAAKIRGCKYCTLRDKCELRKKGESCDN